MKKLYALPAALFALSFVATTASADMLIVDADPDSAQMYSTYWDDNDVNPMDLNNSSLTAEENWVEALLGVWDDPNINHLGQYDDSSTPEGETSFVGYDPGFSWDYALIKAGRTSWAYYDTDSDNILSWAGSGHAVSHISFFGGVELPPPPPPPPPENPVPEPATMLLFGTGLAGLAGLRRRKEKK